MSYTQDDNPYQVSQFGSYAPLAFEAETSERTAFIRRTYLHLAAAVAGFAGIEALIFTLAGDVLPGLVGTMLSGWNFLIVLGAFMLVSMVANKWAHSNVSVGVQYLGLSLYVAAEAVIFVPLLYLAQNYAPGAIPSAAILTGVIFGGLTLAVLITRTDFSFLRMYLTLAGFAALGFIVCSILFQLNILGVLFSTAMIALAAGYILYYTSNVLHHYRTDQHVAAALALFSAVALLFWYVLRLFMALNRR